MRHINLPKFSLLTLLSTVMIVGVFISCSKENLSPALTSNAKPTTGGGGTGGGNTAFNFVNTVTEPAGGCFELTSKVENNGGALVNANNPAASMTVTVTAPDGAVVTTNYSQAQLQANGGMTLTQSICDAQVGTYTIQICETHVPNTGNTVQNNCATLTVVVNPIVVDVCPAAGASLTARVWSYGVDVDGVPNGEITAAFIVNVCQGSFAQLKLQGGLVAKAIAPKYDAVNNPDQSKPWAFISPDLTGSAFDGADVNNVLQQVKANNQNWTITWLINNVSAGYTKTYLVKYNKALLPGSNLVTGQWSLKNGAVTIGDYTDRLVISY